MPRLIAHSGFWRWSAAAQLARLPSAMAPLALTAAAESVLGSASFGGVLVATWVVAEVVCSVPAGRLLDRVGVARGARILLLAKGVAYAGLLVALLSRSPSAALVAAAVTGAVEAGVPGGFRAMLSGVVGEPLVPRAVAVNAMVTDVVIVLGPVLVAALALAGTPAPLLAVVAASACAALAVPRVANPPATRRIGSGRGLVRPLLGWAVAGFAVGHLCSAVEVAALPLAHRLGAGEAGASALVAVFCCASIAGSLGYAVLSAAGSARLAAALLAVMGAGGAVAATGPGWAWLMLGLVIAGVCVGPVLTINSVLAERLMPEHRRAEGFAVLNTAQGLGFAAGSLTLAALPATAVGLLASATPFAAAFVLLRSRAGRRTHVLDHLAGPEVEAEHRHA
ncbi:MFS transporter [Solihabitans fulvus]|uniref:MFS transporter n=1 Tax=Solihabitans fulvus TaxID=1892852 RepID=A0A5B2WKR5_9PSEU|nr:MFS transporter [Solihabitans fulvus]KAA2252401.1 MFS transporter [Solihabitans fulvus]